MQIALLKKAGQLQQKITVCHVHHGLSKNAEHWQAFASRQCKTLELPLTVKHVTLSSKHKNIEAQARDARYQVLAEVAGNNGVVLTGHHSDDQAETLLLALKRGAGLKGLSAMQEISEVAGVTVLRPLLNISRAEIELYANQHDLVWIEDESNQDEAFDRNFIRRQIMPALKQKWPSILTTINRSIEHCQQGQTLLDELAQQDLKLCLYKQNVLDIEQLQLLSTARFNNVIRYFLAQNNVLMPSSQQLAQVYQQMFAEQDKVPAIKVGNYWLRRHQQFYFLTPELADISQWSTSLAASEQVSVIVLPDRLGQIDCQLKEQSNVTLSGVTSIKQPSKEQTVEIRFDHQNPRCLPDYRQSSRSLKKVLQELNIPPWQRKRVPFLYYDNELVAALGHFVCKLYLPVDTEPQLQLLWHKDKNLE